MNNSHNQQYATKEDVELAVREGIDEVLQVIRDLIERFDARFTALEKRMDRLEHRMDTVEKRLDSIEERLDSVERRLDSIEERLIIEKKDSANLQHWAHKVSKKINVPFRAT